MKTRRIDTGYGSASRTDCANSQATISVLTFVVATWHHDQFMEDAHAAVIVIP
jgi:hypothetical protein